MTLNKFEFKCLVISAFRYSLGRMTAMSGIITEIILNNIKELESGTIEEMIREIEEIESINVSRLGMEGDIDLWLDFKVKLKDYLRR
ncbi:hypothetical protein KQI68_06810 [Peptoniphilus sp. MSJ-1]|uniref:Uncharacterized protein n=1 Tax=Peptoniphilus ovalis TaxID=2841503 RepID=A0ABS6FHA3_9FIRM|nr:hypothetical protein [Peptoniphilus ovalis]MBU5669549.1 hypothetical protein [Peptoniphilus ovalis]